ncbi:MAG: MBL fold metallo-hydrolase [Bdellovibrionales bacterium]|nr:MBL fold metallo-hydrolase [Bdellovibrionales bacterium]
MKVTISAVEGNRQRLDGGAMFGNAPRAIWEKWQSPDEKGRIELACRALLLRCNSKIILCETGIGAFFDPQMADRFGVENPHRHVLLENLTSMGIEENDVDYVILSHLHFDHAGGLLPAYAQIQAGEDRLLFPNAKYVVGKTAWERSIKPHPRDRASFIPGLSDKLQNSRRLIIVEGESHPEVLPSHISFFYSHGHTPGQMHTVVQGQNSSVIFGGDLIPGASWVHLPITMGYDRFAELVIDEKEQLYQRVANKNIWIFFTHDSSQAMAQIQNNAGKRFVAERGMTKVTDFLL